LAADVLMSALLVPEYWAEAAMAAASAAACTTPFFDGKVCPHQSPAQPIPIEYKRQENREDDCRLAPLVPLNLHRSPSSPCQLWNHDPIRHASTK
jgi:hypothetical protein